MVGKLTPERLEQMKNYIKMLLFSYFNLDVPTSLKMLDDLSREINAK